MMHKIKYEKKILNEISPCLAGSWSTVKETKMSMVLFAHLRSRASRCQSPDRNILLQFKPNPKAE